MDARDERAFTPVFGGLLPGMTSGNLNVLFSRQNHGLLLGAIQRVDVARADRCHPDGHALRAGRAAHRGDRGVAAGLRRLVAVRQCHHPSAGRAFSAVERRARRAGRNHLPRRCGRYGGVAGARRGRAERGGRAYDGGCRTRAPLSERARGVHRRLGPHHFRWRVGGFARGAAVRELRHREGARRSRTSRATRWRMRCSRAIW